MGHTYKGVPVPPEIDPETDQSDTDRYAMGWKDGVDAALRMGTPIPDAARDVGTGAYRGVLVPTVLPGGRWDAWKAGVDAHYARTLELAAERDKDVRTLKLSGADRPFVDAFLAILADNPDGARQAVKDMSGRDRAVLSFMLTELSSVVDEEELYRRTGQTG